MGLHRQAEGPLDAGEPLHQLVGAGGDKAGRQDGFDPPVLPRRLLQPLHRGPGGGLGALLPEDVRAVAVHVHLAHKGAQAAGLQQLHQHPGCRAVEGGKDRRPGGGSPPQVLHKQAIGPLGVIQVGKFGLLGEGVGVQPVQQLHIHAQPPVSILGGVDVEVHQAGDHQPPAEVIPGQALVLLWDPGKHPGASALQTDQNAVGHGLQMGAVLAVTEIPLEEEGFGFHGCSFLGSRPETQRAAAGDGCRSPAPAGD